MDIGWDMLCVKISLILSEISHLRRRFRRHVFEDFSMSIRIWDMWGPDYSYFIWMMTQIIQLCFVCIYISIYPSRRGVFGGRMTRQWKSLFRWYNATILSKHTLESYFCLHMVCNGWEAHKMMCAERIQTFRPICLYFDSNRLRGLRRVPSESARRLIIESSFEHQSRSPTYLNMTCVQG